MPSGSALARWKALRGNTPLIDPERSRAWDEPAPLSLAQEVMWSFEQVTPRTSTFNVPLLLSIETTVDVSALERSLSALVERHASLRTSFRLRDGAPMQKAAAPWAVKIGRVNLMDRPPSSQDAEAEERVKAEHAAPFDLESGQLLRALLISVAPKRHLLVMTIHHIATDGWSMGVFYREWAALYTAFSQGEPPNLAEPLTHYADYARDQRLRLTGPALKTQLAYWRDILAEAQPLDLPTDRPRPPARSFRGARQPLRLSAEVTTLLKSEARRLGVTPFAVIMAALQVLCAKLSGQDDVVIGTHMANRSQARFENCMGLFAIMCPIRGSVTGELTFRQVLGQARDTLTQTLAHQEIPFEWIAAELGQTLDRTRNPLFQVALNLQTARDFTLGGATLEGVRGLNASNPISKFDVEFYLEDAGNEFGGFVEYATDLFESSTIERMARQLSCLLQQSLASPDTPIQDLHLDDKIEQDRLVFGLNNTAAPLPARSTLAWIAETASRHLDQVALIGEEGSMTYGAMLERAGQVAALLRAKGVSKGVIGLHLHRSSAFVTTALGIMMAGAAFLPLDPDQPVERLGYMLAISKADFAFTDDTQNALPPFEGEWLQPETGMSGHYEAWSPVDLRDPPPEAPAYVIFTSGSTGKPKGVMVPHRALLNNLLAMQETYALRPEDRMAFKTPVSFDVAIWELFWPLVAGATIVVAAHNGHRDPIYLTNLIRRHGVTVVQFVPSMLQVFLDDGDLGACDSLRLVIAIGEALPRSVATAFFESSKAQLHNLYGPAEATIHVTAHALSASERAQRMPIGRPIRNSRVYVVDRGRHPCPVGVIGDLYIAGACLALGYLNAPELTAEKFIPDPFHPGELMYDTGDRASWNAFGQLDFHGRLDHQLKIRGVRIEVGEIEAALQDEDGVDAAAVNVRAGVDGLQLVGYLVASDDCFMALDTLRQRLRSKLPATMIPAVFERLQALPLSANGKLDRGRLEASAIRRPLSLASDRGEETPLERTIVGVWRELLGTDALSADDDFIDHGSHSLLAVRAAVKLRATLDYEVDIQAVYEARNARDLARRLEGFPA